MKIPVSFVTTYELDDFIEKKAKELGISKSDYVEKVLREYLERIERGEVEPRKFMFLPRQKTFLSIKMQKELNWAIKHQALLKNVTKQDIFNCALEEKANNHRNQT